MLSRALVVFAALAASAHAADAAADKSQAAAAPASKPTKLQRRRARIEAGHVATQKAIANMAAKRQDLINLAADSTKLDHMTSKIEARVQDSMSHADREKLENEYSAKISQIKSYNMSDAGAKKAVKKLQEDAKHDAEKLRSADKEHVRALHREFVKARRAEQDNARALQRKAREAVRSMGSATKLELTEENAGVAERTYDHDEDQLQDMQDKLSDQVSDAGDDLSDAVDSVFDKVHERVEARSTTLEEQMDTEDRARRSQMREARMMQEESDSEVLAAVSDGPRTNTICATLVVAGVMVSLWMFAMRKSSEIRQPELLA